MNTRVASGHPKPSVAAEHAPHAPPRRRPLLFTLALLVLTVLPSLVGQDFDTAFDQANKLYEQGDYLQAAAAYQALATKHPGHAVLLFNLGNAWFKAGQFGKAIATYRTAQTIDPRDPSLRFNLGFVRQQVSGTTQPPQPFWQRSLQTLTVNEWTALAAVAWWLWCILLSVREARPALGKLLRGYTAGCGFAWLVLTCGLALAAHAQFGGHQAVVIHPKAAAHLGPLPESKVAFPLRDGSEVQVLDSKEITSPGQNQTWLHIADAEGRRGWVSKDQLLLLRP